LKFYKDVSRDHEGGAGRIRDYKKKEETSYTTSYSTCTFTDAKWLKYFLC